jgi:hypothetical protein
MVCTPPWVSIIPIWRVPLGWFHFSFEVPSGSIYSNCFIGWPHTAPQARVLERGEVVCIIETSWFLYGDSLGANIRKNTRRVLFIKRSNGSDFVTFRMCFSLFMFYLALLLARVYPLCVMFFCKMHRRLVVSKDFSSRPLLFRRPLLERIFILPAHCY